MRPATASDPDGPDAWRYRDLAEVTPAMASLLVEEYGEVWLREAELPEDRRSEVGDTLELRVADEWDGYEPGTKRLRLTSWYTGETNCLYEWMGDVASPTPTAVTPRVLVPPPRHGMRLTLRADL